MALSGNAALAQTFTMSVESTANLYAVGQTSLPLLGGGTLPPAVVLTPGIGRVLIFATMSGSVSYNNVDAPSNFRGQYNGPDGGAVNFQDANWPNNYLTSSSTPGLLPPQYRAQSDDHYEGWSKAAQPWRSPSHSPRVAPSGPRLP